MKTTRRHFLQGSAGLLFADALRCRSKVNAKEKSLPVIAETDICVLGGSCTGVFAAIRAARLGARVIIIEKQNAFGGVATNSLVFVWHSINNTEFNKQIIAGLTLETMERLQKRDAVIIRESESGMFRFNSQELKIELDEMILENNIRPFLHTLFSEPVVDADGRLIGVIVDNKNGRGIITAKAFIDATGDGDLCHRLGMSSYTADGLLPPTTCAHYEGWQRKIVNLMKEHGDEVDLPEGFVWGSAIPGSNTAMIAGTRVYNVNCAEADDLTRAEMEGRRQVRAVMDLARKYLPDNNIVLTALPSYIGIRQTRQIDCQYQLTGDDVLYGKQFDDAIAYGSYRVDIHHQDKPGITFRYLDGREVYSRPGYPSQERRWRPETATDPTFYQIPLRSIIPGKYDNLILAGRMFDADKVAFSGARVMVNMNQLGEAAGTAAYLALDQNKAIPKLNPNDVRNSLQKQGSIML